MVVGENGIFSKAKEAKEKTNIANIKEQIQMEIANKQTLNEGNITDGELEEVLKKYGTINYEEDGETIKGITTSEGKYEISIKEIYNGKTENEPENLARRVITAQNYGDEVNYSANGVDSWKVFLNDGKNVYIISSDYVPNSNLNINSDIIKQGEYGINANSRDGLVNWLKETTNWSKYIEAIEGAVATGGPTLEQFWESYNKKYKTNYSEESLSLVEHEGYNDILYFPHKEQWNNCRAYWLASPNSENPDKVETIDFNPESVN